VADLVDLLFFLKACVEFVRQVYHETLVLRNALVGMDHTGGNEDSYRIVLTYVQSHPM
jgi:hypothetical protein